MAMIQISNLNSAVETESFLVELQETDSDNILGGSSKGHGGYGGKGRGNGYGHGRGNGYGGDDGYGGKGHGYGYGRGGDDD